MDLRQLEMFKAVAENNSFTRASRKLHVAQSAISRKIRILEDELGALLFKRVNRKIFLTAAGETLLVYTRKLFKDLDNARLEVSEMGQAKRGRLKIGGGMIACIYTIPFVLERFKEAYPEVELEVETGPTEDLVRRLRNNDLDLGLFTLPVEFPDLEVIHLYSEEMVVVCSPKQKELLLRKSLKAKELAGLPLILFQRGTYTRKAIDELFRSCEIEPQISMEGENFATMKPLIKINLGVGILPLRAITEEVKKGELHYLKIEDYDLEREQGLVFLKSTIRPKILEELIQFFEELTS